MNNSNISNFKTGYASTQKEQIRDYSNDYGSLWSKRAEDTSYERCSVGFRKGCLNTFIVDPVQIERFYSFQIGEVKRQIPIELLRLNDLISKSKKITELEEDWDANGALRIEIKTWEVMILFLIDYSIYVFNNFGLIINMPSINPCPNGSIDLVWRTPKARLLVNIKPYGGKLIASYYGDLYENKQAIKQVIESNTIVEHFAFWMKNLS